MAIFDDGTPLDAAILQDLDRRLTEVKSSIPKIGTTVIDNSTVQQVVKSKQIFGGEIPSKTIKLVQLIVYQSHLRQMQFLPQQQYLLPQYLVVL